MGSAYHDGHLHAPQQLLPDTVSVAGVGRACQRYCLGRGGHLLPEPAAARAAVCVVSVDQKEAWLSAVSVRLLRSPMFSKRLPDRQVVADLEHAAGDQGRGQQAGSEQRAAYGRRRR